MMSQECPLIVVTALSILPSTFPHESYARHVSTHIKEYLHYYLGTFYISIDFKECAYFYVEKSIIDVKIRCVVPDER